MMKIKKLAGEDKEYQQRNFKFITLNKLETYCPKKQILKIVSNKVDNKYKFPPINHRNSQFMRKSNCTSKLDDFEMSM